MSDTIEVQSEAVVVRDENPQQLMRKATDVAGVCREIVLRTAVNIQGKSFVKCEGWEAIAVAHGCFAGAGESERVYDPQGKQIGYKACGYVRNSRGEIISTGEGFVGFDERDRKGNPTWATRAEYAGRAMAQTRAISRACRSAFAHVVVLIDGGLSTTPFEEVPDGGFRDTPSPAPKPVPTPKPAVNPSFTMTRDKFIKLMLPHKAIAETVLRDKSWLLPNEQLQELPLDKFPKTPDEFNAILKEIQDRVDVQKKIDGDESSSGSDWREFKVPFGKNKGIELGQLAENSLAWYVNSFEVTTVYNGKPKKPETIEADKAFRAALDAARTELDIQPEDVLT